MVVFTHARHMKKHAAGSGYFQLHDIGYADIVPGKSFPAVWRFCFRDGTNLIEIMRNRNRLALNIRSEWALWF
jgi:hypothetical protein